MRSRPPVGSAHLPLSGKGSEARPPSENALRVSFQLTSAFWSEQLSSRPVCGNHGGRPLVHRCHFQGLRATCRAGDGESRPGLWSGMVDRRQHALLVRRVPGPAWRSGPSAGSDLLVGLLIGLRMLVEEGSSLEQPLDIWSGASVGAGHLPPCLDRCSYLQFMEVIVHVERREFAPPMPPPDSACSQHHSVSKAVALKHRICVVYVPSVKSSTSRSKRSGSSLRMGGSLDRLCKNRQEATLHVCTSAGHC